MVKSGTDDVFKRLEQVVDKMKKENVFYKKKVHKETPVMVPPKKKSVAVKKPVKKIKKIHNVLGIPKMKVQKFKIKGRPHIALVEMHKKRSIKSKIENTIIKDESKRIKSSNEMGKIGIKQIKTESPALNYENVAPSLTEGVVSVEENEKIAKAIELMLKNDISGLAVTSKTVLKGTLESEDIVKKIEKSEPKHVESLLSKQVQEFSRPAAVIEENETFGNVIQKMDTTNSNRLFVTENQKPVSVISKSDVIQKIAQPSGLSNKIETGIDKLLELVEEKGKISTEEASKILNVDSKLVESWASILEDHNLIKTEYPIIGTIELIKK